MILPLKNIEKETYSREYDVFMSKEMKPLVKSLRETTKRKIFAAAAGAAVVIAAAAAVVKLTPAEEVLTAKVTSFASSAAEAVVSFNPAPKFSVNVTVDGATHTVRTSGTVNDALTAAGVTVDDDDLINIGFSEPLNRSTEIVINRVEVVEEVKLETIDYATEYQESDNYVIGYSEVLVDGEEGELAKTIQHTYVDGKLTESNVVSEEVTEEPVDEVIVMGTNEVNPIQEMSISVLEVPDDLVLDENNVPLNYTAVYTGKACAYSARPTAKTASGRQVAVGHVAVDPSIFPYGTELFIVAHDGTVYGYAIAADTGTGLLEGFCLVDLFMESYEASCDWGARQVDIYVLG